MPTRLLDYFAHIYARLARSFDYIRLNFGEKKSTDLVQNKQNKTLGSVEKNFKLSAQKTAGSENYPTKQKKTRLKIFPTRRRFIGRENPLEVET